MTYVVMYSLMWPDLLFTIRLLRKSPGFLLASVLTLALGIGVNTAVFSVVNAVVLRPLPVKDGDRLMVIASRYSPSPALKAISFPDLRDCRAASAGIFEDIAGYSSGFVGLKPEGGRSGRALVTWVTGNYFALLGIQPALGRLIRTDEGTPGRTDAVLVLGYSAWRRRFGANPAVIGRKVTVDGRPCTIVGVAPPEFLGTFAFSDSEAYLPLNWSGSYDFENRGSRSLHTLARLLPDVMPEQAQAAMEALAGRLEHLYPSTNKGFGLRVVPERLARPEEDAARSNERAAMMMLGLVALVLIVAAVNVTNLLAARGVSRLKELAIRAALGAARARLVRLFLMESLIIGIVGGSLGLLLAGWAARALGWIRLPGDLPVRFDFHVDSRVLVYATALSLVTGFFVGLVPALRSSSADLNQPLRGVSRPGAGHHRIRSSLVVGQIAVCYVLLVASGLLISSLIRAEHADLGIRPDAVLNLHMDLAQLGYSESRGRLFFDEVERRVRGIPGIEDTSYAFSVPFGYVSTNARLTLEGNREDEGTIAGMNLVGTRYFDTMGIPIIRGRSFANGDRDGSRLVAVVNRRLADLLWPGRDPIGRRFSRGGPGGPWIEVVGVSETGKYRYLFEDPTPYFYLPIAQHYTTLRVLHLRTSRPPESLAPAVERVLLEREPELALYDVQSMSRALGSGYGFFLVRTGAAFAALFGILGLALAVVGLYGVVSHKAARRTHEIGVRTALGASRRDIRRLILGSGLTLVLLGLGAGLLAALGVTRIVGSFLFGTAAADPVVYVSIAAILGTVTVVASMIPAVRAARVDPMIALRDE